MSAPPGRILVMTGDRCACIKLIGKANCNCSPEFKALLEDLWKRGCLHFTLDLTDCVFMDSTFLGMLAWSGLKVNEPSPDKIERRLELYNPSETIADLIESLGVIQLFEVTHGQAISMKGASEMTLPPPTSEACKRASFEAHKLLSGLNKENADKFKDVLAYLADDLKKFKSGGEPDGKTRPPSGN